MIQYPRKSSQGRVRERLSLTYMLWTPQLREELANKEQALIAGRERDIDGAWIHGNSRACSFSSRIVQAAI